MSSSGDGGGAGVLVGCSASQRPRCCAEPADGTVTFNVGGTCFEVLPHVIQKHPSTLLAILIDDIGTDAGRPIFVDANPERFLNILDWYRYGKMYVQPPVSIDAVLRDARYFMLPDHVLINGHLRPVRADRVPSVRADADRASCVRQRWREQALEHWPGFPEYLEALVQRVVSNFDGRARSSCRKLDVGNIEKRVTVLNEKVLWYEVSIVTFFGHPESRTFDQDVREPEIVDESRLTFLMFELRQLGFECDVVWRCYLDRHNRSVPVGLTLRIGVRL